MLPKVSCIMPTCYGKRFVEMALGCWLDQDYAGELELVIVDNNDEPLGLRGFESLPCIKYVRSKRKPVGALRNEGIRISTGDVICIWDEDDWHSRNRVSVQVDRLIQSGKAVTGWHNVFYYDGVTGGTYKYLYEWRPNAKHPPYAMGASQCFWKSWWAKHPYVEVGVEDQIFSNEALHAGQLDSCDAGQLYVVRTHSTSQCPPGQLGTHKQFPAVPKEDLPHGFFSALEREKAVTNSAQAV